MSQAFVHFEIPADDVERAQEFYGKLFGWQFENMPGPMEYWMVKTGEGGPDGGLMKRQMPEQRMINYAAVDSVDEHSSRATELGGQIVMPKQEIPDQGAFAIVQDPEGNVFGLWESHQGDGQGQ